MSEHKRERFWAIILCACVCLVLALSVNSIVVIAQPMGPENGVTEPPTGEEVARRLQQGLDDPDSADNQYRGGGVDTIAEVIQNMKQIAQPIWKDIPDSTQDRWYSPHLRDSMFDPKLRREQAVFRGHAGTERISGCFLKGENWCLNGHRVPQTACPKCQQPACGNIPWPHRNHLAQECCIPIAEGSKIYSVLINDSNFKTCCVRDGSEPGDLDETRMFEERIACRHREGSGWAGIFEYYYPTTIIGLENQRAETMIATRDEVKQCLQRADQLMEASTAVDWVTKAAQLIKKTAEVPGTPQSAAQTALDEQKIKQQVQDDIKLVRPTDQKLRFSDSLTGEGLTARPFLPAYDRQSMKLLARHFCMRDEQFYKLMDDSPKRDRLQRRGAGGKSAEELATKVPIWGNYCPEGVELMTNTANSRMTNIDRTDTDFVKGMRVWDSNPLYGQAMHLSNENLRAIRLDEVLAKVGVSDEPQAAQVGYTGLDKNKLSGGMVPVSLYRHVPVERRTAIADHVLGFVIAGGLFPPYWMQVESSTGAWRSTYKRFEPQPYSMTAAEGYQTFWGRKFIGGNPTNNPTNEVMTPCTPLVGRDYNTREAPENTGNSDQLFLSNFTHESFTQVPIVNANGKRGAFDRYVQNWAENEESKKKIRYRGLDKNAHNYAVAFRIFATCPAGYSRWRPDRTHGSLSQNVQKNCAEENFGSPRRH